MRNLLLLLFFIPFMSFGQDNVVKLELFENDLDRTIGSIIKLPKCDDSKCGDIRDFFISIEPKKYFNGKKKGVPYSYKSDYSKLSEQQFKIVGYSIGKSTYSILGEYLTIELTNPQLGNIFINTYSKSINDDLIIVSDIELPSPETMYCSEFTQTVDKFDDKKTTYTRLSNGGLAFIKVEHNEEVVIYLKFGTRGNTLNVNEKGAMFIFENGETYSFPDAEIDVKVDDDSKWMYSVFVRLSDEEIKLFTKSPISDAKLYIYTAEYNTEYTEKWRQELICLINDTYKVKS